MKINSCSHTEAPNNDNNNREHKEAWWQVDLEDTVEVKTVVLTTRQWRKDFSVFFVP